MFASQVRIGSGSVGSAPPTWAIRTVKCCVVGLLTLPLAVPILLAVSMTPETGTNLFQKLTVASSVLIWVGMFASALSITSAYPPVPRR